MTSTAANLMAPADGARSASRAPSAPSAHHQILDDGARPHPCKHAEADTSGAIGAVSFKNLAYVRAHRGCEAGKKEPVERTMGNDGAHGARLAQLAEAANNPRTFTPSERAQEPPRWRVCRTPDGELDEIGSQEPWGVFVDDPSSELGDLLFVDAFLTHAEAVAFADRQARS